jgi:putative transposase
MGIKEVKALIKAVKIRLRPTKEQEVLMWKSAGVARFAYNWGLTKITEAYKGGIKLKVKDARKSFNQLKKTKEYHWLKEVSAQVTQEAFQDLDNAFKRFFEKKADYPRYKSKKKTTPSFFARYDAIKFKDGKVNIEKIGKVKYSTNQQIPQLEKYTNTRVTFDGKYWHLSLGWEHKKDNTDLTPSSIGIDIGIKRLAVISNLEKPIKNINKSTRVKKLKKKLTRLQRQVSRKYEMNKQGNTFIKTKNIVKLEKRIRLIHRKLKNIRLNHIHQATSMIVKTKPSRVVMEHLNIQGMMKNRHLAKAIQEQSFYEFKRQMEYKSEFAGIEFVEADGFYPSSKKCSCCGNIKKDLKLNHRTYVCENCGLIMDRDKNAAINLSHYKISSQSPLKDCANM